MEMYLWIAIDVNEQIRELRENAENYIKNHELTSPTLTLPFHISLKISFQISSDILKEVTYDIREFCKSLKPFTITVKSIEKTDTIIWLTMQDSAYLTAIHNRLDQLLLEKYGVVQHEFDKSFIFHTSILITNSKGHLNAAFEAIKDINIPNVLNAQKIIIGSSKEGQPGTYNVIEEIML